MNIRILLYIRYFCLIIFFPFTIIFGFLIKLIRPFFLIRWSQIINTRIGHHAANLDMYFLEKNEKICKPKMKYLDIFYKPGLISANKQLEKMWDKKIFTLPWFIIYPLEMLRKKGFFKEDHAFETTARDRHGLSDSSEPILKFNSDELERGEKFLKSYGLDSESKFVCLHVRDSAYLNDKKHDYHNFRNSNIETFKLACDFLASKNIFVFRMGKKVSKKISFENEKIIDYANCGNRSDFLDIFLGSRCTFWLATGSGIDSLAQIFRRPIAFVNQVPIGYITTSKKNALVIFKKYFDRIDKKEISILDLKKKNLVFANRGDAFVKKNINILDNTEEEILELTKEMVERININFWESFLETKRLQEDFWTIFPYDKKIHGNLTTHIGKNFLQKNQQLLKKQVSYNLE